MLAKSDPRTCFEHLLDLLKTILPGPSRFLNFEFSGPIGRIFSSSENSLRDGQFCNLQAMPGQICLNTSRIAPSSSCTPGLLCVFSGAQAGELSSVREKTPRGRAMAHACMHGMISNLSVHSYIFTGKTRVVAKYCPFAEDRRWMLVGNGGTLFGPCSDSLDLGAIFQHSSMSWLR